MFGHNACDEGKRATFEKVEFDFSTRYVFEKISSRCSLLDKEILELGCGAGRLSYLALKRGAASVTLVDSSPRSFPA
jgi:predicted RNA methylase